MTRPGFRALAGAGAVAAVAAVVTGLTRWAGPPIYCGDGWFHVRYATLLRAHGISRVFPWWQESFLRDRFADFNLLYHLLLIPFTLGDEMVGARVLAVVAAAAAMVSFWALLRALRVPWPSLWAIGLIAIAPELAYRLTYSRPLVLGLAILFLGLAAVFTGRAAAAFGLTFLYAHTHCSFHLLPALALLHDAHRTLPPGTGLSARFRTSLAAIGGAVAGSVLTPYFPNNLSFWWTANVGVLKASWAMGDLLRVGTEMLPAPADQLLLQNLGVFLLFAAALYGLTRVRTVADDTRTLLAASVGFLGLTLLSRRFVELWAPLTVLLAGSIARDLEALPAGVSAAAARLGRHARAARLAVGGALVVALCAGVRHTLRENQVAAAQEEPARWRAAARWMKANVPADETIFHLGWDEFPELFFEDTTHRYLIGQDATFFWATSPERCRLWEDLAHGTVRDAWAPVRETFRCRHAFVPRRYVSFLRLARRDPRFTEVWSDPNAVVFRLDDDGKTIGGFAIAGVRPDPHRVGFDEPLEGEPGGPVATRGNAPPSGQGFVDLARLGGVPPGARDACAVATTSVPSEAARDATIGLTTDDEVKLYVNGHLVFSRSPYRTPAISLDALFGRSRAGDGATLAVGATNGEIAIPVHFDAGSNAIAVKACRVGETFGFVLRER